MRRNLFVVDIEPLDNRYTQQWYEHIPDLLRKSVLIDNFNIIPIHGEMIEEYTSTDSGAFFSWAGTSAYKASQAVKISKLFANGEVKENDVFFFTDAWNPTVHTVRYISELSNIPVKCAGIWHAGWYDPTDILGLKIQNIGWVSNLEQSMYAAYDLNFFGTKQHADKFQFTHHRNFSSVVVGYPFEWIDDLRNDKPKEKFVVFPHRLNEDKAPWVFDLLANEVHKTNPEINFIKTQEQNFTKEQYYIFLQQCSVVFSANKHENLGIGTFEAMSAGCLPLVPNKLSYAEMYSDRFKYNISSDFYDNIGTHIGELAAKVIDMVENRDNYLTLWKDDVNRIQRDFFSGYDMIERINLI